MEADVDGDISDAGPGRVHARGRRVRRYLSPVGLRRVLEHQVVDMRDARPGPHRGEPVRGPAWVKGDHVHVEVPVASAAHQQRIPIGGQVYRKVPAAVGGGPGYRLEDRAWLTAVDQEREDDHRRARHGPSRSVADRALVDRRRGCVLGHIRPCFLDRGDSGRLGACRLRGLGGDRKGREGQGRRRTKRGYRQPSRGLAPSAG